MRKLLILLTLLTPIETDITSFEIIQESLTYNLNTFYTTFKNVFNNTESNVFITNLKLNSLAYSVLNQSDVGDVCEFSIQYSLNEKKFSSYDNAFVQNTIGMLDDNGAVMEWADELTWDLYNFTFQIETPFRWYEITTLQLYITATPVFTTALTSYTLTTTITSVLTCSFSHYDLATREWMQSGTAITNEQSIAFKSTQHMIVNNSPASNYQMNNASGQHVNIILDQVIMNQLKYSKAYNDGYNDGYVEGGKDSNNYQNGYNDGFQIGKYSQFSDAFDFINAIFYGLGSILDINIIGSIKLGDILLFPILFGLLNFIIGLFRGNSA